MRPRRTSRRIRPSGRRRWRPGTDVWRRGIDASREWRWPLTSVCSGLVALGSRPGGVHYFPSMVILGLDTTTPAGSCALVVDQVVLREEASDESLPPATRLPRDLMTILEHASRPLAQVDVFAVA